MISLDWGGVAPRPDVPANGPFGARGLEIGGGPNPMRPTCRQFDIEDWKPQTGYHYDIGDARQLPYTDESFSYVYSSNLLEHFSAKETTAILTEWSRVLKSGGELELVVPDVMGILRDYFNGIDAWTHTALRILGHGRDHKVAFTLSEFPNVIARVPTLRLVSLGHSHQGGGVHSVSVKL